MAAHEPVAVSGLVELDRTSLRERAVDRLRTAVAARELEPGTRLVETELSAALGISRGTLREALRQLEHEGLVEVGERGRLTVRPLTDAELTEMFTVRAALEGLAASILSTSAHRAGSVERLQAALDALGAVGQSIGELIEADLAFHRLQCELTGNVTLIRAWETLTGPARMAFLSAGPATAIANMSAAAHRQLVDAIAAGDPTIAARAIDAHMRQAAESLLAPESGARARAPLPTSDHRSSRRVTLKRVNSQRMAINKVRSAPDGRGRR